MRKVFNDDTVLSEENKAEIIIRNMSDLIEVLPETEDELIDKANALYTVQNKSGYYLGLLFAKKEQVIKSGYENWKKMHKSINDRPPVATLHEWFQVHSEELQFTYAHAKNCISLFLSNDQAAGELLGPQKHSILKRLPEPEYKSARSAVIAGNLSVSQTKTLVKNVQERLQYQEEKEAEVKPRLPKIDIIESGTQVVIRCKNGTDAAGVFDFLVKHEESIKRHAYNFQKK